VKEERRKATEGGGGRRKSKDRRRKKKKRPEATRTRPSCLKFLQLENLKWRARTRKTRESGFFFRRNNLEKALKKKRKEIKANTFMKKEKDKKI